MSCKYLCILSHEDDRELYAGYPSACLCLTSAAITAITSNMDSTIVSPSSQLLYILNHQLVADELAASIHVSTPVLDVVDHAQLVSEADKEAISSEKAQSAIHR